MSESAKKQPWEERITEPDVYSESGVRSKVLGDDSRPLEGMRVLWVDPDHAFSTRCRGMLEAWGATIVVVEDAGAGVDTAAVAMPDVVVVSYDREDSSGDQVARVLHYMLADPPPVILVSKRDFRGFDGGLPGVARILPKPFDPRAMLDALMKIAKIAS